MRDTHSLSKRLLTRASILLSKRFRKRVMWFLYDAGGQRAPLSFYRFTLAIRKYVYGRPLSDTESWYTFSGDVQPAKPPSPIA